MPSLQVLLACSRRRVDRPHLDKAVAEVLSLGDVDPRALVFLARYLGGRGAGDDADGDAMRLLREAIRCDERQHVACLGTCGT